MKYIKIILRDKSEVSLPFDKAETMLSMPNQLIMITDENGKWTGETINKSEIIKTEIDKQREIDENRIKDTSQILSEPKKDIEKVGSLLDRYKPDFTK